MNPVLRQLIRYVLIGSTSVAILFTVLAFCVEIVGTPPLVGTTAGFLVGSTFNYLMQHYWVFEATRLHRHAAPTYALVTLGGMVLNATLFSVAHWGLAAMTWLPPRLDYLAAQAFSAGIVFFYNFWANRRFTFEVEKSGDLREAASELMKTPAGAAVTRAVNSALSLIRTR